jgi:hypothetical protein
VESRIGELDFTDLSKMSGEDLAANIEGTKSFIRNCFEKLPAPDVLETALGYKMVDAVLFRDKGSIKILF